MSVFTKFESENNRNMTENRIPFNLAETVQAYKNGSFGLKPVQAFETNLKSVQAQFTEKYLISRSRSHDKNQHGRAKTPNRRRNRTI
jgi:hypothetical protein